MRCASNTARLCRRGSPSSIAGSSWSSPNVPACPGRPLSPRAPASMETKAIMSSDSLREWRSQKKVRCDSFADHSRSRRRSNMNLRRYRPADSCDHPSWIVGPFADDERPLTRGTATARRVLALAEKLSLPRRAGSIPERSGEVCREPASLAENFALAESEDVGGIKHGTVRIETTPHVRAAGTIQITQTRCQRILLRVASSRLRFSPQDEPSRSDRPMDECSRSEEHNALHNNGGQG
jgi:hypothetical protein